MRKHLYKGKRISDNKWTFGGISYAKDGAVFIVTTAKDNLGYITLMEQVYPETVCEYTGIDDKNGTNIFEGDILAQQIGDDDYILGVVKYGEGTFDSGYYRYTGFFYEHPANGSHDHTNISQSNWLKEQVRVIGNIHENKNLLED